MSEQGLFYSWAVEFDALGYPADEYFERSRLAVTWSSLTTLAYMVIVIGVKLIVTIYKLDGGNSANPAVATAVAPSEAPTQRRKTRRPRVDLRHCLDGSLPIESSGSAATGSRASFFSNQAHY